MHLACSAPCQASKRPVESIFSDPRDTILKTSVRQTVSFLRLGARHLRLCPVFGEHHATYISAWSWACLPRFPSHSGRAQDQGTSSHPFVLPDGSWGHREEKPWRNRPRGSGRTARKILLSARAADGQCGTVARQCVASRPPQLERQQGLCKAGSVA